MLLIGACGRDAGELRAAGALVSKGKLQEAAEAYERIMRGDRPRLYHRLPLLRSRGVAAARALMTCRRNLAEARPEAEQLAGLTASLPPLADTVRANPWEKGLRKQTARYVMDIAFLRLQCESCASARELLETHRWLDAHLPEYDYLEGLLAWTEGDAAAARDRFATALKADRRYIRARLALAAQDGAL